MSKKKSELSRKITTGEAFGMDLLVFVLFGFMLGFPGIRLLCKGGILRPRKWFWMLVGGVGFIFSIVALVAFIVGAEELYFPAAIFQLLITIYSMCINREYVAKYNVLANSGYWDDMEREQEANRIRQQQTWEHQAQQAVDASMVTDSRIKAARPINAKPVQPPQQPKPIQGARQQEAVPAPTVKAIAGPTPKPTPRPAARKVAEPAYVPTQQPDPDSNKRKLDL